MGQPCQALGSLRFSAAGRYVHAFGASPSFHLGDTWSLAAFTATVRITKLCIVTVPALHFYRCLSVTYLSVPILRFFLLVPGKTNLSI